MLQLGAIVRANITGKVVAVHIYGGGVTLCHRAIVVYQPTATMDSWEFRDVDTGTVYYISEGCTIELLEPANASVSK